MLTAARQLACTQWQVHLPWLHQKAFQSPYQRRRRQHHHSSLWMLAAAVPNCIYLVPGLMRTSVVCHNEVKAGIGVIVWSMPERLGGFTTRRYVNPLYLYFTLPYVEHSTPSHKKQDSKENSSKIGKPVRQFFDGRTVYWQTPISSNKKSERQQSGVWGRIAGKVPCISVFERIKWYDDGGGNVDGAPSFYDASNLITSRFTVARNWHSRLCRCCWLWI